MKKIISLCLVVVILLGTVCMMSCTNDEETDGTVANSDTVEDGSAFSTVRREDYGEYEFKILYFSIS